MEQTRPRLVRVGEHRGWGGRAITFEARAAVLVLQGQELAGLLAGLACYGLCREPQRFFTLPIAIFDHLWSMIDANTICFCIPYHGFDGSYHTRDQIA